MRLRSFIKGGLTFIPGMLHLLPAGDTGGTTTAEYCYGVWIKHLTLAWQSGMRAIPRIFAELGPGASLGIGIAAMLSGADKYYALDVVRYADSERNLRIFDDLVALFQRRAPSPIAGWPDYSAHLDQGRFPSHILTEETLTQSLAGDRLRAIRRALEHPADEQGNVEVRYMVPWTDAGVIRENTVDFALSHSVMEHVVDIRQTYGALYRWLRPGGVMSHQVDFTAHRLFRQWDGYRACSEPVWRVMLGRRPFLINREPCSRHLSAIEAAGFEFRSSMRNYRPAETPRERLARRWKGLSDDDMNCCGAFIQASKPEWTPLRMQGVARGGSIAPADAATGIAGD